VKCNSVQWRGERKASQSKKRNNNNVGGEGGGGFDWEREKRTQSTRSLPGNSNAIEVKVKGREGNHHLRKGILKKKKKGAADKAEGADPGFQAI